MLEHHSPVGQKHNSKQMLMLWGVFFFVCFFCLFGFFVLEAEKSFSEALRVIKLLTCCPVDT